jgi:TPR repeat protein
MGMSYSYGIGVDANPAEAQKWYRKAAAQGHTKAKEALEQLKRETKAT